MSIPCGIMGIMYANVDSLCCRLSSHGNKSETFVAEQAQNTGRIKAIGDVGSRGHQFAGDGLCAVFRTHLQMRLKTIFYQVELSPRRKGERKYGLIFAYMPTQLDCDQVKQRRL